MVMLLPRVAVLLVLAALQAAAALSAPMSALKADFRLLAARSERGFAASPDTRKRLQDMASELEASAAASSVNEPFAPTASPRLLGKWYLDFCDAADVLSLSLLPLPLGSRLGPIYQEVAAGSAPDKFVVQNGVEFMAPGMLSGFLPAAPPLVYEVEARCQTLDATRVSLLFVGGLVRPPLLPALGGALPDPIVSQLQGLLGERVFLETTYLDDDMRVGRGPGRELYVLSKRPALGAASEGEVQEKAETTIYTNPDEEWSA